MKIGIDARLYGPKTGGGGLGRYIENLVGNLQNIDKKNKYVLFLRRENFDECKITNPNFEKRLADVRWYTLGEQTKMPKIIDQEKLDLMHYPHFNVPLRSKTPFVVTIHDLILLDQPNSARATTLGPMKYFFKHWGYKRVIKNAVKKSKRIISVSEYTKKRILHHFQVNPKKIDVVYEGAPTAKTHTEKVDILEDYGINKPYFLYVGSAYPHKNLESLLHAFAIFHKKYIDTQLVLIGTKDIFYEWLERETSEIGLGKDDVIFAGFVSDAELDEFYAHARMYFFPSLIEGFGLPPLEAMSHGLPVAASRSASLPEILGGAALFFDPHDLEDMIEAMRIAVEDNTMRQNLITKGLEQIKKYSWRQMATDILAVYEKNTD